MDLFLNLVFRYLYTTSRFFDKKTTKARTTQALPKSIWYLDNLRSVYLLIFNMAEKSNPKETIDPLYIQFYYVTY